jgi:hypothetical protein
LAGSLGTPHVSYIISVNKDKSSSYSSLRAFNTSNKVAANAPNTNVLRTKTSGKRPRSENSHVLHKTYVYNKSITALVDPNHLLQEDSSNDARGKTRHPLEATYL